MNGRGQRLMGRRDFPFVLGLVLSAIAGGSVFLALAEPGLAHVLVWVLSGGLFVGGFVLAQRRGGRTGIAPVQADAQRRFEAVLSAMHDAIIETDWQGIREVNESFCRMTGFSRGELIGAKAPYPFWPAEEYAAMAAALETSMRGQARDFELVLLRKNGERFPVLLSVSRILGDTQDAGARGNRVLYSFRDISELKRAEEKIHEGERRFRALFDSKLFGIVMSDREMILDANHTFLAMTGYSREELKAGLRRELLVKAEEQAMFRAQLEEMVTSGEELPPREYNMVRKDGGVVPIIGGSVMLKREPVMWLGFALDVSVQKAQARELAEAKERAEAAQRENEGLLNLLNRELRGPMTPILGLAGTRRSDARLPEDVRNDMEIIRRNAEHVKKLMDEAITRSGMEPAGTAAAEAPAADGGSGVRVLLVEDHADTARVVSQILQLRGFAVRCATTAAQGIEACRQGGIDVLLCDLALPDGSGYEVLMALAETRGGGGRRVPAIAFSGYATADDVERTRAAGFVAHVTKPVDVDVLIGAVERAAKERITGEI